MISGLSNKLFRNAILTSGSSLADVVFTKKCDALNKTTNILNYLGCSGSTYDLIECAKKIAPDVLLKQSSAYMSSQSTKIYSDPTFSPVTDNYFLLDEPEQLFKSGKFKKCSILTGTNKDEGNFFLRSSFPEFKNKTAPELSYSEFERILTDNFYYFPKYPLLANDNVKNALIYRYTNWSDISSKTMVDNLDYAVGDYSYACPMIKLIDYYSDSNLNVYQYFFAHKSTKVNHDAWLGVIHGDQMPFVLAKPLNASLRYLASEVLLSKKMISYWSGFVKYNDPNYENRYETWPKYKMRNENDTLKAYIILKSEIEFDHSFKADYCAFWNVYIRTLDDHSS